jgi:hypothetical protein
MKNTIRFLGIIILAAAGFLLIACPTGDGSKNDGGFLASLKPPDGVKSVYLSDIPVNGGGRAAAGGNTISSLSYITPTGQNAPMMFSASGKKQFIFEVTSLQQLGERGMIIGIDGYYEVTGTGAAGSYTVGPKVDTSGNYVWDEKTGKDVYVEGIYSVLIDMKNGKLYDFSEFRYASFIEGNIIYTSKDGTVYKIDLSTAAAGSALKAVPLNNGAFLPTGILLPYTINNKLICGYYNPNLIGMGLMPDLTCLDISGIIQPVNVKFPPYPASTSGSIFYRIFSPDVLVRDLTGKPWAFYSFYNSTNYSTVYSTAEVSIDDSGQCVLNNENNVLLSFNASYYYDLNHSQIFTFNAAGVGNAIERYLNNGVVTISDNGFIRLRPEVDGIKVESVEVTMPDGFTDDPYNFFVRKSVISREDYLFWLGNKTIKRLKLAAGSAPQDVYSNVGIMDDSSSDRELLTASGRKLIFYQYAAGSATEVHTYSLDMYNPNAEPELLATNDAEIRSIVELDF